MTWDEIERTLGTEVIEVLRSSVRHAYVAAARHPNTDTARTALDSLLMTLVAAVILKPEDADLRNARLEECCRLLRAKVGAAIAAEVQSKAPVLN